MAVADEVRDVEEHTEKMNGIRYETKNKVETKDHVDNNESTVKPAGILLFNHSHSATLTLSQAATNISCCVRHPFLGRAETESIA